MEPNTNNKIIAGAVGILVIAGIVWAVSSMNPRGTEGTPTGGVGQTEVKGEDAFRPENEKALATVEGGTRETIATSIPTPGVGETAASPDIAIPITATPVGLGTFNLRIFEMKGEGGKFVPSTIVVNAGDVVQVKFTAVDADYTVSISDFGVSKLIKKGTTANVDFQPYDFGQYKMTCASEACAATGMVIANERK